MRDLLRQTMVGTLGMALWLIWAETFPWGVSFSQRRYVSVKTVEAVVGYVPPEEKITKRGNIRINVIPLSEAVRRTDIP